MTAKFQCRYCGEVLRTKKKLEDHIGKYHTREQNLEKYIETYQDVIEPWQ